MVVGREKNQWVIFSVILSPSLFYKIFWYFVVYFIFNLCFWLAAFAFIFSYIFLLTMFIIMHQHTEENSLYVKTYLAVKLILVIFLIIWGILLWMCQSGWNMALNDINYSVFMISAHLPTPGISTFGLSHTSHIQDIHRRGNGWSTTSLACRRSHQEHKSHLWMEPKHTAANWCRDNIVVNLLDNPQKEADGEEWNVQPVQYSRSWWWDSSPVRCQDFKMLNCRLRGGCGGKISSHGCRPFQDKRLLTSIYQGRSEHGERDANIHVLFTGEDTVNRTNRKQKMDKISTCFTVTVSHIHICLVGTFNSVH